MTVYDLPAVNAILNGTATVLLFAGWLAIRARNIALHKKFMLAAGTASALFLGCYLVYHAYVGSVPFKGMGMLRAVYFAVLISHVLLAIVIAVLVPMTFWRAFKNNIEEHRRIARITFPIWMYVSITGVVIYMMLYKLFPNG